MVRAGAPPPAFVAAQKAERERRAATAMSAAAASRASRIDDTFSAADSVRMMETFPQTSVSVPKSSRLPALLPSASSAPPPPSSSRVSETVPTSVHNAVIRELTQRMMSRFHQRLAVQAAVANGQMPEAALAGFSLLRSAEPSSAIEGDTDGRSLTSASRGPPDSASRIAGASSRASVGRSAPTARPSRPSEHNAGESRIDGSSAQGDRAPRHAAQLTPPPTATGHGAMIPTTTTAPQAPRKTATFADDNFTVELAMRAEEEVTALAGFRLSRGGARDRPSGSPRRTSVPGAVGVPPLAASSKSQRHSGGAHTVPTSRLGGASADATETPRLPPILKGPSRTSGAAAVGAAVTASATATETAAERSRDEDGSDEDGGQMAVPGTPPATATALVMPAASSSAQAAPTPKAPVAPITACASPRGGAAHQPVRPANLDPAHNVSSLPGNATGPVEAHGPETVASPLSPGAPARTPTSAPPPPRPALGLAPSPVVFSPQLSPLLAGVPATGCDAPDDEGGTAAINPTAPFSASTSMPSPSVAASSFYGEKWQANRGLAGAGAPPTGSGPRPIAVPVTPATMPSDGVGDRQDAPTAVETPACDEEPAGPAPTKSPASVELQLPVAVQRSAAAKARLAAMRDKVGALSRVSNVTAGGSRNRAGNDGSGGNSVLEQRHIDALRAQQEALEAILTRAAEVLGPTGVEAAPLGADAADGGKKASKSSRTKRSKTAGAAKQGSHAADATENAAQALDAFGALRDDLVRNIQATLSKKRRASTKGAVKRRTSSTAAVGPIKAPAKGRAAKARRKTSDERRQSRDGAGAALAVVGEAPPPQPAPETPVPELRLTVDDDEIITMAPVPTPPGGRGLRDVFSESMRTAALGTANDDVHRSSPAGRASDDELDTSTVDYRRSPTIRRGGTPQRKFTMRHWEPTKTKAAVTDLSDLVAEQEAADAEEAGTAALVRKRAVVLPEERRVTRALDKLEAFRRQATERDAAARALLDAQVAEVVEAGAMEHSAALEEALDEELLPELPKEVAKRQRYREKLELLEAELEGITEECLVLRTGTGSAAGLTRDDIVRRWIEAGLADDDSDETDEDDPDRQRSPPQRDDGSSSPPTPRSVALKAAATADKAKKAKEKDNVFGDGGFAAFMNQLEEAAMLQDFTSISCAHVGVQVDPVKPKAKDLPDEPSMDPKDPTSAPNQIISALYRNEQALYRTLDNLAIAVANVAEFFSALEVDLTCRACLTTLSQPRSLLGCGHCFCAECVNGMYIGLEAIQCAECTHVSHAGCIPNPTVESIVSQWNSRGAGREDTIMYELATLRDAISEAEDEVMSAYGNVHAVASKIPGAPGSRKPRFGGKSLKGTGDAFDLTNVRDVIIHARVVVDDM